MRHPCRLPAVIALAACAVAAPAAEPTVAFAVKDGWVSLALTGADGPIADAQVEVYTAAGHRFAEGETGADGRGEFPLPPGPHCRVEIRIGDRRADSIRLTRTGDRLAPSNVLLSFGLAPCCRIPSGSAARADRSATGPLSGASDLTPLASQITGGLVCVLAGLGLIASARSSPPGRRVWKSAAGTVGLIAGLALAVGVPRRERPPPTALVQPAAVRPPSAPLAALLADTAFQPVPTQAHPLLGQPAPAFTLTDTDGQPVPLSPGAGAEPVVLVFYYGYHCNHCVGQLFDLHRDVDRFRELGATVLAVSADPADLTRAGFQRYGAFAFPVLSDPTHAVAAAFGTFAPGRQAGEAGHRMHGTFVIDRAGRVTWANRGDEPFTDTRTLLIELHRGLR